MATKAKGRLLLIHFYKDKEPFSFKIHVYLRQSDFWKADILCSKKEHEESMCVETQKSSMCVIMLKPSSAQLFSSHKKGVFIDWFIFHTQKVDQQKK